MARKPTAESRPTIRHKFLLPVKLTPERRGVLGAELAEKNALGRELTAKKSAASADYRAQIGKVQAESIQIEEALKTKGVRTVPLDTLCELRPSSDGGKDVFDVFRLDTDPPVFVKKVHLPPDPEQLGLAGVSDEDDGAPSEAETAAAREKAQKEQIAAQLKDVPFPTDEEEEAAAGGDDDGEEEDPFATKGSSKKR